MNIADKLSDRLLEVDSGCWEFVGARTGSGYGTLTYNKVQYSTHKLAYIISNGPVPQGMFVCHSCDNKICCNPDHMFLGNARGNKHDEIKKDRHVKGSRQGNSKLVESDIPIIRQLIQEGYSLKFIGDKFGVTDVAIGHIKSGQNWGWIK